MACLLYSSCSCLIFSRCLRFSWARASACSFGFLPLSMDQHGLLVGNLDSSFGCKLSFVLSLVLLSRLMGGTFTASLAQWTSSLAHLLCLTGSIFSHFSGVMGVLFGSSTLFLYPLALPLDSFLLLMGPFNGISIWFAVTGVAATHVSKTI